MVNRDENVGLAFALVTGAGLSTALGAMVVFFPFMVKFATRTTLAAALAVSAGVMVYVSFAEIFLKSVEDFEAAGADGDLAMIYATVCFFGGIVFMVILNTIVDRLVGRHSHSSDAGSVEGRVAGETPVGMCHDDDPVATLDEIQQMVGAETGEGNEENQIPAENRRGETTVDTLEQTKKDRKLIRMSINTALAIALHNFPEGLATFCQSIAGKVPFGVHGLVSFTSDRYS